MKKFFTLLVLSLLAVTNVSAAEEVLWTGDKFTLEWGTPWNPGELVPALFTKEQFATFETGQKFYFYFETISDDALPDGQKYRSVRFARWNGAENSLGLADSNPAYDEWTPAKITLEITADVKTNVAGESAETGGFTVCGHGVKLVRVTKEVADPSDIAPALLWQGEITVNGYGASSLDWDWTNNEAELTPFVNKITTPCNLYLLIEGGAENVVRIAGSWGDWSQTGYPINTQNYTIDGDNVVKIPLTQDFVTKAFVEHGGFAVWGNGGFTIKAIATTKETLLSPVTTDANGFATYSSNFTLALNLLPAELEAYTANLSGKTLSFTQKTEAVGSGTGLLIKGAANTTYYLPAKSDATEPAYNALSANLAAQDLKSTDENYIFVMKKATTAGDLTFKPLPTTDTAIPANKAYVTVAKSAFSAAPELTISFDGNTTGVENLTPTLPKGDGAVYDLQGRKVVNPTKGLFIMNGKMVIFK